VLLRSIIVEREPIDRQQETVHGFADGMFGISAQEMVHLCDDRLGRALDRLFDADRTALLTELVLAVGQRFGVRFDEFHNDSTSISFCGSYRGAHGRQIRGRTAPAITYGRSKAHRPDLKQLLFILTMSADGNVPVAFRCTDGNTSDWVPSGVIRRRPVQNSARATSPPRGKRAGCAGCCDCCRCRARTRPVRARVQRCRDHRQDAARRSGSGTLQA
jgi:hypothetical protein